MALPWGYCMNHLQLCYLLILLYLHLCTVLAHCKQARVLWPRIKSSRLSLSSQKRTLIFEPTLSFLPRAKQRIFKAASKTSSYFIKDGFQAAPIHRGIDLQWRSSVRSCTCCHSSRVHRDPLRELQQVRQGTSLPSSCRLVQQ